MHNILIVDDERDIVNALKIYLRSENYTLFEAFTGKQALETVSKEKIDLIIMDIMMPELDGVSATAKLREFSNIPIILLTAKSEDADILEGLDSGADDYITKPFSPTEVQARVRSQLRRYTMLGGTERKPNTLVIGNISLNDESKQVTVDGDEVSLTPMEYAILKLLMSNPGKVYSSQQLFTLVSGEEMFTSRSAVAVHIRHIREKIEINPSDPRYLKVVWGQGYKIHDIER